MLLEQRDLPKLGNENIVSQFQWKKYFFSIKRIKETVQIICLHLCINIFCELNPYMFMHLLYIYISMPVQYILFQDYLE